MTFSTETEASPSSAWGKLADLIRALIEDRNASESEASAAKAEVAKLENILQEDQEKINQLIDIATSATPA